MFIVSLFVALHAFFESKLYFMAGVLLLLALSMHEPSKLFSREFRMKFEMSFGDHKVRFVIVCKKNRIKSAIKNMRAFFWRIFISLHMQKRYYIRTRAFISKIVLCMIALLLLLSGDVEQNPGPISNNGGDSSSSEDELMIRNISMLDFDSSYFPDEESDLQTIAVENMWSTLKSTSQVNYRDGLKKYIVINLFFIYLFCE